MSLEICAAVLGLTGTFPEEQQVRNSKEGFGLPV
jgi:hypothetical protein